MKQLVYRLATPTTALCFFGALAVLWVTGAHSIYFAALRLTAIEPGQIPFIDFHSILAAAQCARQGIDVYIADPCDILQRAHPYSPLWLIVTPRAWGTQDTIPAGAILDLLFIFSWIIVMRPRSMGETLIFVLVAFSPTTIFALERANVDIIIFLLVLSAAAFYLASHRYRVIAYVIFLVAGLLKYYPLVLLAFIARERWRRALWLAAAAVVTVILFGVYYRADLDKMFANIPGAPYFTNAFSARNLPYGFAELMPDGPLLSHAAIAVVLLSVLSAVALVRIRRNLRLLATIEIDWTERETTWLAIGCLLLAACFFAGPNIDYRGIFFLLVVPGLLRLRRSSSSQIIRRWLSAMIAVTVFIMWREFFRISIHAISDFPRTSWLGQQMDFLFWLGREVAWWWLVTGLAAIAILYFRGLPLTRNGIAGLRRLSAFPFKLSYATTSERSSAAGMTRDRRR